MLFYFTNLLRVFLISLPGREKLSSMPAGGAAPVAAAAAPAAAAAVEKKG